MVKMSEWRKLVADAWRGEPCNRCGRPMIMISVSDDGLVEGYCGICGHGQVIDRDYPPATVEPEPIGPDDLPF